MVLTPATRPTRPRTSHGVPLGLPPPRLPQTTQVEKELLAIFAAHLSAHAPGGPEASGANAYTSKKAAKKRAAAAGAEDVAAAAQAYLEGLAASGRYQRDVWYA